jgi:hypothetical protein
MFTDQVTQLAVQVSGKISTFGKDIKLQKVELKTGNS